MQLLNLHIPLIDLHPKKGWYMKMKYEKPMVEEVSFTEIESVMVSAASYGLVDGSDWFVEIS